jgi:hypothetical protein
MLQVIAKLEGPAVSQYCALRLLQVETSSRLQIFILFSIFFPCLFDSDCQTLYRQRLMNHYMNLPGSWYEFDMITCFFRQLIPVTQRGDTNFFVLFSGKVLVKIWKGI